MYTIFTACTRIYTNMYAVNENRFSDCSFSRPPGPPSYIYYIEERAPTDLGDSISPIRAHNVIVYTLLYYK